MRPQLSCAAQRWNCRLPGASIETGWRDGRIDATQWRLLQDQPRQRLAAHIAARFIGKLQLYIYAHTFDDFQWGCNGIGNVCYTISTHANISLVLARGYAWRHFAVEWKSAWPHNSERGAETGEWTYTQLNGNIVCVGDMQRTIHWEGYIPTYLYFAPFSSHRSFLFTFLQPCSRWSYRQSENDMASSWGGSSWHQLHSCQHWCAFLCVSSLSLSVSVWSVSSLAYLSSPLQAVSGVMWTTATTGEGSRYNWSEVLWKFVSFVCTTATCFNL